MQPFHGTKRAFCRYERREVMGTAPSDRRLKSCRVADRPTSAFERLLIKMPQGQRRNLPCPRSGRVENATKGAIILMTKSGNITKAVKSGTAPRDRGHCACTSRADRLRHRSASRLPRCRGARGGTDPSRPGRDHDHQAGGLLCKAAAADVDVNGSKFASIDMGATFTGFVRPGPVALSVSCWCGSWTLHSELQGGGRQALCVRDCAAQRPGRRRVRRRHGRPRGRHGRERREVRHLQAHRGCRWPLTADSNVSGTDAADGKGVAKYTCAWSPRSTAPCRGSKSTPPAPW